MALRENSLGSNVLSDLDLSTPFSSQVTFSSNLVDFPSIYIYMGANSPQGQIAVKSCILL